MNQPTDLHAGSAAKTVQPLQTPTVRPDLHGRHVLITGGGAGIGRCLVLSYAQAGAAVSFFDQNQAAGEETLAILREQQLSARFWSLDVADVAARDHTVAELLAHTSGRLDILINNAAIANAHAANLFAAVEMSPNVCPTPGKLGDSHPLATSLGQPQPHPFDQVLAVNLAAPFHLTRLLTPALIAAKGCVINLASTRAFMSEPDSEGYAASKGGIVALTHAMAISLGQHGVRVNSIAPGWIDTTDWQLGRPDPAFWPAAEHAQHPAGRIGVPADIAAACFYLSGPDAGFVTGENIVIDGGMTRKMIYL